MNPSKRPAYLSPAGGSGIALCLSGGGFRAALFHLGAVRRLHEVGLLDRIETIASVSGGSQIAAHLARTHAEWYGHVLTPAEWDRRIAAPFRAFTERGFNSWPVFKGWLLFWTNAGVEAMAARARSRLTRQRLCDLPPHPWFIFCATDLVAGDDWIFNRSTPGDWDVATAVAISSCLPGYFRAYTKSKPQTMALVDGGVDDDRGIEPVWQSHTALLVSDGGDTLRPEWGQSFLWSMFRSAAVLWNRSHVVQQRWLQSLFDSHQLDGACWGIGDSSWLHHEPAVVAAAAPGATSDPELALSAVVAAHAMQVSAGAAVATRKAVRASPSAIGYSPALARDVIASIRTAYDAFSPAEAAVLENHGYLMTESALRTPGAPPHRAAPVHIPHPAWMGERKIREELAHSARQRFFGNWRWPLRRHAKARQP
jgi:NTE family protein